jgi:hypothetical protein
MNVTFETHLIPPGTIYLTDLLKRVNEYHQTPPMLNVLNIVATRQVAGARRGARVKSLALAFHKPWVHVFKPILLLALDQFYKTPTIDVLKQIYDSVDIFSRKYPIYSLAEKRLSRGFYKNRLSHYDSKFSEKLKSFKYYDPQDQFFQIKNAEFEADLPIKWAGFVLPLKIPLISYENEIGDVFIF